MKLTLLGTGSPGANPQRRGPSQVIESGGELVLIDCGAGVAHRLVEAGYARHPIRRLAITHLHSDHITGLADLLWAGWVGRWWDVPPEIAGPPGTMRFVETLLDAFAYDIAVRTRTPEGEGLHKEWLIPKVEEVEEAWKDAGSDWQLSAFRVDHVQVDQAFGYRVDGPGGSMVISGDTRRSENLIHHSQGAEILVHEVIQKDAGLPAGTEEWMALRRKAVNTYHTPSDEVGKIAREVGTKHLVLSHLVMRGGGPEDLKRDASQDFGGPVTVGEDLQVFDLP